MSVGRCAGGVPRVPRVVVRRVQGYFLPGMGIWQPARVPRGGTARNAQPEVPGSHSQGCPDRVNQARGVRPYQGQPGSAGSGQSRLEAHHAKDTKLEAHRAKVPN